VARLLDRAAAWRFLTLSALAFGCLALGAWGFALYPNLTNRTLLNELYQSLQLFFWAFWQAPVDTGVPWQLEISRWLAPLVTASAVLTAFGAVIRRTIGGTDRQAVARLSGHTVVIGLGAKGAAAVSGLSTLGDDVVAIERDPSNPAVAKFRAEGVPVIIGEGESIAVLSGAGVQRASQVIVVCDSEVANIRIASVVRRFVSEQRDLEAPALVLAVHATDTRIAAGLVDAGASTKASVRVECVNAQFSGVAMLLNNYALPDDFDDAIVVVGAGELACMFLVIAAKRAQLRWGGARLRVRIVAPEADEFVAGLGTRFRGIDDLIELIPVTVHTVSGHMPDWSRAMEESVVAAESGTMYVLCDSDQETVAAALHASRLAARNPDRLVVVALREPESYSDVLGPNLHSHALLGTLLDPEIALGGTKELLARAVHAQYVANNAPAGTGSYLAEVQWAELSESDRAANRDPAADIPRKLAAIGFEMVPLTEWDPTSVTFSPEQRTQLAEMEHERWCRFKEASGYVWGSTRNDGPGEKSHPDLVPWSDLDDVALRKDYDTIDHIPELLAMIGYRMKRVDLSDVDGGSTE